MKFCEITSFSGRPFDFLADEKVERKKMQLTKTFFMHNYHGYTYFRKQKETKRNRKKQKETDSFCLG